MKTQRSAILTSLIVVILLAVLALFFFWIEETIPQDGNEDQASIIPAPEDDANDNQLYLTIMTHMEQSFKDDVDEELFLLHVEELRYAMKLADSVGAILSIESEKPFALANTLWEVPILREILENGHGVQTHCDLGKEYTKTVLTTEEYSEAFLENKTIVDKLIGEENNIGCSGGGGLNDWATAASLAGFKYLNGIVGAHLLAIPYENRPSEIWTNEYILSGGGWHKDIPQNMYERIYPIPLADVYDLEADDDPVIIMLPGTINRLDYAAEDEDDPCTREQSCEFNVEDIETLVTTLRDVAEQYDPERGVAKMTIYIPSSLYVEENGVLLNAFFSEMGKLADEGLFQFGTHKEIYEAYIEQTGFEL